MDIFKEYAKIAGEEMVETLRQQGDVLGQVKKVRHAKQMSQQQLADTIGVSKSTIARIESGASYPNTQTLQKIADALDTQIVINPSRYTTEMKVIG